MKKTLLFCMMLGLSIGMIFAVDITDELVSGTWSNTGSEFTVKFNASDEATHFIDVGFLKRDLSPLDGDTNTLTALQSGEVISEVSLAANASTNGRYDNSATGSEVYLYYQVRTDKDLTFTLKTIDMTSDGGEGNSGSDIPFFIDCTSEGLETDRKVTVDNNEGKAVMKFTPEGSGVTTNQNAVKLDIYTTKDKIPSDSQGAFTGKIELTVTTTV